MTTVDNTVEVDDDGLAAFLARRRDLVIEAEPVAEGDGLLYEMEKGPCTAYGRRISVTALGDGRHRVRQRVDFRLGLGPWSIIFRGVVSRRFAGPGGDTPWWAPPAVLDVHGARALASLAYLALVSGYLGTLITQTITYAADEFDVGARAQSDTLAAVRIGVIVSMVVAVWADRRGRRRALLLCAAGGCLLSAAGALAPGMIVLGGTQTVARGLATALSLLIAVVAAEEMPAGARAYGASLLTMAAGLGAGVVLWVLPVVEVDEKAWRILYVLPLLFLPVVRAVGKNLQESRRFVRRHAAASFAGHGRRLFLLAATAGLVAVFSSPASQLQNEFLREEFSFSASRITVFTILTATPASIGIVVGGRLADTRGRRLVGGVGVAVGAALTALEFVAPAEVLLWAGSAVGAIGAAVAVPALAVYGPELFPTSLRSKANVVITVVGVVGSVVGLVVAGRLSETWDLGPSIAVLAVAPIVAAAVLLPLFPESAQRELEELNPEDALGSGPLGGMSSPL